MGVAEKDLHQWLEDNGAPSETTLCSLMQQIETGAAVHPSERYLASRHQARQYTDIQDW